MALNQGLGAAPFYFQITGDKDAGIFCYKTGYTQKTTESAKTLTVMKNVPYNKSEATKTTAENNKHMEDQEMAENKKLDDEMMADATGGENIERGRYEYGRVTGFFENYHMNRWSVTLDDGREIVAAYYAIGKMLDPGTRVKVQLVGMGKWDIVDFPEGPSI